MENFPVHGVTLFEEERHICATAVLLATFKRLHSKGLSLVIVDLMNEDAAMLINKNGIPSTSCPIDIDSVDKMDEVVLERLVQLNLERPMIYVTNTDVLIRLTDVDRASRILHRISRKGPVFTRIYRNVWTDSQVLRLHSICSNLLSLKKDKDLLICETIIVKPSGTFGKTIEEFTISDNFTISAKSYTPSTSFQRVDPEPSAGPSLPKTMFDIGANLSEEDRRAKAATKLPFTSAQEQKGLVSLNIRSGKKIRAGGQIIYTPDEADDLDDSDPDEDLMI